MDRAEQLLQAHPLSPSVDISTLSECITACYDCSQVCHACADSCLSEQSVEPLLGCIRLNHDCGDICQATARLLSRQTDALWELLRAQLEACATGCRLCAAECDQHANRHEHCRISADACRNCEEACQRLLAALPAN